MNKKVSLLLGTLLIALTSTAQQNSTSLLFDLVSKKILSKTQFTKERFFTTKIEPANYKFEEFANKPSVLLLDKPKVIETYKRKPNALTVAIPYNDHINLELLLIQQDINTSGDFSFGTKQDISIQKKTSTDQGVHYRGYIAGDSTSFACISIFANGEVMGLFCNQEGNYTLGKMKGNLKNEYIIYNSNTSGISIPYDCTTIQEPDIENEIFDKTKLGRPLDAPPPLLCKKLRFYWEADFKLYSNNFGYELTDVQNYILGLFNQVATMYQNEGILIELAESYVWTSADPYTTTTSSTGLSTFVSYWSAKGNNFKGDIALLLDGAPTNNGGRAYLRSSACSRAIAYGYANVYANYKVVPIYSWDVKMVTHEIGHLLGAHHTQWCGWNTGTGGTCGGIDDCGTVESSNTCTTCPVTTSVNPVIPSGFKGTVMSYCQLVSGVGINLANGFGPLPQAVIRNSVNVSSCTIYNNIWTGAINTAWENVGNWSCGIIPNANTDVTILEGCPNYPLVSSVAICRSLKQSSNTSLNVKDNYSLTIVGQ